MAPTCPSREAVDGLEEHLGLKRRLYFDHDAGLRLGIAPPRVCCAGGHHERLVRPQGALASLDAGADPPGDDPKALLLQRVDVLRRTLCAGGDDDLEHEPPALRVGAGLVEDGPVAVTGFSMTRPR